MTYLALISGGIDSPVAAHLFLKQGLPIEAVIYDSQPFTAQEEVDTALETVEKLSERYKKSVKANIIPFGSVQEQYLEQVTEDELNYSCIFARRMMLRVAASLREKVPGLITGDSLGQVASQTLDNISVIDSAVDLPVYRPLLGFNKTEIVDLAKKIGTFSVSSAGGITCAARTEYPETHGQVAEINKTEERFNIEQMIDECLEKREEKTIEA